MTTYSEDGIKSRSRPEHGGGDGIDTSPSTCDRSNMTRRESSSSPASRFSDNLDLESDGTSPKLEQQQPLDLDLEETQEPDEASLRDELEAEKELYPGASTWAPAEERLFEILFLRQHLPLLPSWWAMDFRGVPISDTVFHTSGEKPPIVHAHTRDFHATTALTRLIEITANVRATCQSGLRHKVPMLIRNTIERYMAWAAEDGGYQHLRHVPNIIVAAVHDVMDEDAITAFMQRHMRALGRVQREFLKEPRDADFWTVDGKALGPVRSPPRPRTRRNRRFFQHKSLIRKFMVEDDVKRGSPLVADDRSAFAFADEPMTDVKEEEMEPMTDIKEEEMDLDCDTTRSQPASKSPCTRVGEELACMALADQESPAADSPADRLQHFQTNGALVRDPPVTPDCMSQASQPASFDSGAAADEHAPRYRRHPPVVYGLFVLHTTVFLVTLDSAKGDDAEVSYHVDMCLTDVGQSVWNALTIAIAVCLARDELMTRLDDFEPLELAEESDPDA